MQVTEVRHAWPEHAGFVVNRPFGLKEYTFLHFFNPVEILVGGKRILTKPDACIFYSPATPQWFCSSAPIIHDWAHYDESLKAFLDEYGILENHIYYPDGATFITELFREIENEYFSDYMLKPQSMRNKTEEFLIRFARSCNGHTLADDHLEHEPYIKIRQRIILELSRPWTVAEMAKLANLSSSRFHVVYKRIFGISPLNDLILARMNAARNRLVSGSTPVYQIAAELGYSNQYHFIKQFKKTVGCSPSEYRNRNGHRG